MMLLTGGAYQGKTAYLLKNMPDIVCTDGETCSFSEAEHAQCINHYHALIRRIFEAQEDPAAWTARYCDAHPDGIILLNETGCGIIPLDSAERRLRELTGICGCIVAEHAQTVIRITCGIPSAIKGDLP